MPKLPLRAVLASAAVLVAAASCSSDSDDAGSPTTAATSLPATTAPTTRYYLSLGDSYASGFEAGVGNTTNGFAYAFVAAQQAG